MTLQAGDIAIIGVQSDTPDAFSFVALTDIPTGEQIFFTDNGVFDDGTFRLNEGIVAWTAPDLVPAGTIIAFTGISGAFTEVDPGFALATSGDQVFAYQGTTANPTFLFAVQTNSTQFQTGADDANQSALPPGLVVGMTAVAVGAAAGAESEFDNSSYTGSVTTGTREELLAAIANAANWTGSNSPLVGQDEPITVPGGSFTVTGGTPSETGDVIINEMVVSTTGDDREFVEFVGTPGQSLDGFSLLEVRNGGQIDTVLDLAGLTIGDNGFLLGTSPVAESVLGVTGNFQINNNTFTNASQTYLLVEGFSGMSGDDIDTDNDGVVDTILWTAISDSVAFIDNDNPLVYSEDVVGPDGSFLAPGGFRDPEGTGPFQIHDFSSTDLYTPTAGTVASSGPDIVINEIVVSTSGDDREFIEFAGTPGESFDGLSLLEVRNGGEIDTIIDLTGLSLGENGFLLGTSPEAEAQLGVIGNFQINNNTFTNASQTYLLVEGFSGMSGDDIDTDNDGTIDATPWTAIVDDIALIDDDNPLVYSANVVGPDGPFLAPGAFRAPDITGAFQIHEFSSNDAYTPTAGVFPVQPLLINEIVVSTTGDDQEFVELIAEAGTSLDGVSLVEVRSGGEIDTVIDLSGFSIGDNGFFLAASPVAESALGVVGNLQFANNTLTNASQTYLLVRDLSGADGDDIDSDNDGVIDNPLWTEIIDSVALIDDDNPIIYSANVLGPDGIFLAPGGFRDPEGSGDFELHSFSSNAAYTPTAGTGDVVSPEPRLISEIQGEGRTSTLVGATVLVEAVVTSVNNVGDGNLRGFFIQEEDVDSDENDLTSEGIFVFSSADVSVGDLVRVTGTVNEFFGETQISSVTAVELVSSENALPTAAEIVFPVAGITTNSDGERIADLEAYEGMLINVPQEMTVSDLFTLGRFGDIGLNAGGFTEVYTQANAPSVEGFSAFIDQQVRQTLVLDDGSTVQNPATIPFEIAGESGNIPGQFDAGDALSAGDTVEGLTGVLRFSRGSGGFGDETYRLIPTETPAFVDTNPREDTAPEVGGSVTVAAFNVLNFFTTLDDERSQNNNPQSAGPNNLEPRGANDRNFDGEGLEPGDPDYVPDLVEFERQLSKLIATLSEVDADVVGLIELENEFSGDQNGDGLYAIDTLVEALSAATGTNYAYVDPGVPFVGTDAIAVGLIYDADAVRIAHGTTVEILTDADLAALGLDFGNPVFDGSGTSRAPLAATFEDIEGGGTFTVAVNHFKSKGSISPFGNNTGIGDGTGNNNEARLQAAIALDAWLDTDPTGSGDDDFLILGDLNAYAMEDPITFLKDEGYDDLVEEFLPEGEFPYSFGFPVDLDLAPQAQTFGALDYALANSTLASQVTGAAEWHINADEASALDYNLEFKPQSQIDDFFAPDPFRSSDHDPLILGLNLTAPEPDFEVLRVNDWFSEQRGTGGFNVSLEVTLTDDVIKGDSVERFTLDIDYNVEGASFSAGWLNGFSAPIEFDRDTGTFSTEDVGFVRTREVGTTLNVNVQVQGAGFDADLLSIGFVDRDPLDDLDNDADMFTFASASSESPAETEPSEVVAVAGGNALAPVLEGDELEFVAVEDLLLMDTDMFTFA